jgi:DNA-binding MarR family transcriptional regulator
MHALMSIGRLIRQRNQGETLDTGSFWLLKTLAANGAMRVTDLATCTNLDPSTVSRHVTQLHRAGLIERTPDPDDRRAQRVQASSLGLRQLDAALRARLAVLERTLDSWEPQDVRELDRLLTRFVRDIDTLTEDLEKKS